MNEVALYLLMISFGREEFSISVIEDFLRAEKPEVKTRFLVIENSNHPELEKLFDFSVYEDLQHFYYPNPNKAAAINYAIGNIIREEEAFVICIDNDISFKPDYFLKYFKIAEEKGEKFYFGSSFFVEPPDFNKDLIPYLSGSALGQPDLQFEKMEKLMFLGFSYAFFKSQWRKVGGLDERFSPGSKYDLAAEESIFQKKLKAAGYEPFFVSNNAVQHKALPELYSEEKVLFRQQQNGFTHGFQNLIASNEVLKLDCIKILAGLLKRCVILYFQKDRLKFRMKAAYTKGVLRSFLLYFKIEDRSNFIKISI